MKLQYKFLFLFLSFTVISVLIIISTRQFQFDHIHSIHKLQENHIRHDAETILELKSANLRNLTDDYSLWNDMARFITRPDQQWALENIETTMINFSVDIVWIYGQQGQTVYHRHFLPKRDPLAIPVPSQILAQWSRNKTFPHFFIPFDQSVIEVFGAPVQPSSDLSRSTDPKGYLFFGRYWSDKTLNETGHLISCRLSVVTPVPDTTGNPGEESELVFYRELPSFDGQTAALLQIVNEWPMLDMTREFITLQTYLGVIFSGILLIVFPFLIYRWTVYPLNRIERSLTENDITPLKPLAHRRDIFGRLSGQLSKQFQQSTAFELKIRQLTEAEHALKQSEEKYRQLFDRQMDAILIVDAEYYRCIDANPAALALYRCPAENLRTMTALDISDEKNIMIDALNRTRSAGYDLVPMQRHRRADGTVFFVEIAACLSVWNNQPCISLIVKDITARVDHENALRQQQLYLRQIIDLSPNFIFVKDREGKIILANKALADFRGMTAEDMIGKSEEEINANSEEISRFKEADRRIIESRTELFIPEEKVMFPDGTTRWLQTVKRPVFGAEGEVVQIVGVATDITFHKEAEEKVLRLYHLYALLSQINQVILRFKDRDQILNDICTIAVRFGHFRFAWTGIINADGESVRIHSTYGLESTDIHPFIQRLPLSSCHDDPLIFNSVQNTDLDPLVKYLSAKWDIHSFALIPLHCNKTRIGIFGVHNSSSGFFDEEETNLMREIGLDISFAMDAISMENQRRQSENKLRILFRAVEQSPSVVMITDKNGMIEYVNPKFTEITGYTSTEMIGRQPNFFKPGFLPEQEERSLHEAMKNGGIWKAEFQNRRKDGSRFWTSAVVAPVWDESDEITHFLAIKEDITKHVQLESELQQARKMDSIGRLAGGIAHDFNNLLTAILGYSSILQYKLPPSNPLREDVGEIIQTAKRAANLTHQLLAFSRKQTMRFEHHDLNDIVLSNCNLLRRILEENIELATSVYPEPVMITADRNQIEQVIMNLVINARDAISGAGKINITVTLGAPPDSPEMPGNEHLMAMMSVTDNGCGIPADIMPQLFEPFFTTKEKGKGTGLGLSTVYGIVKQSGGDIIVSSVPEQGSVFTVYLPVTADKEAKSDEAVIPSGTQPTGETILLVEDDETVCGLVREILENTGYHVLVALRGEQAVQMAKDYHGTIHLLLTDIIMPEMDGKELGEKISSILPDIKIVYMSGYADEKLTTLNLRAEDIAFVQKPFLPEVLIHTIRKKLDHP